MKHPELSQWIPYVGGIVASPGAYWLFDYAWRDWKAFAIFFTVAYVVSAGLPVFWRTPMRKGVSTALAIGVGIPILLYLSKYWSL
ncbi:MAG: hypothetical protein KIS73_07550 [Enhydrobacter sp.]|nr:hypothetical protein [Enhydrobacter sp.]